MVVLVGHSDSRVSQKVGSLGCGRLYAAAWKLYAVLVKDTFCAGGSICGINLNKFTSTYYDCIDPGGFGQYLHQLCVHPAAECVGVANVLFTVSCGAICADLRSTCDQILRQLRWTDQNFTLIKLTFHAVNNQDAAEHSETRHWALTLMSRSSN